MTTFVQGVSSNPRVKTQSLPSPRIGVKLFVGGLPQQITENELSALFRRYGEVVETVVIKEKGSPQQQSRCALIRMGSIREADKAARSLENTKHFDPQSSTFCVRYANGEAERLGVPEQDFHLGIDLGVLSVGGLPQAVTQQEVIAVFDLYGPIKDVELQDGGFAIVRFSYKEDAMHAIKCLNGTLFSSESPHPLDIKFGKSRSCSPSSPSHVRPPPHVPPPPTDALCPVPAGRASKKGPTKVSICVEEGDRNVVVSSRIEFSRPCFLPL